jgi:hypothetical protein
VGRATVVWVSQSFCDFGLPSMNTGGESALVRFHFSKCSTPDSVHHPIPPPATLITVLPAHNPWRIHLHARMKQMHTGLGVTVMRTDFAQVLDMFRGGHLLQTHWIVCQVILITQLLPKPALVQPVLGHVDVTPPEVLSACNSFFLGCRSRPSIVSPACRPESLPGFDFLSNFAAVLYLTSLSPPP